jgi:hypothetical protein
MEIKLCRLEMDTSFLYAPINEDVYIRQPLGFSDCTMKVCHVTRCLYGLPLSKSKQSPATSTP